MPAIDQRHGATSLVRALAHGLAVAFLLASPAAAQKAPIGRVAIAFGFGRVNPLPIDLPYSAPAWSATLQLALARHLLLEGTASGWRHAAMRVSEEFLTDRDGRLVFSRQVSERQRDAMRIVAANAIATAAVGRVRFSSGGGVAVAQFARVSTLTVTACTASRPYFCDDGASVAGRTLMGAVQAALGADVTVTRRLAAFVSYRFTQPFSYGLGELTLTGGLRVGFH